MNEASGVGGSRSDADSHPKEGLVCALSQLEGVGLINSTLASERTQGCMFTLNCGGERRPLRVWRLKLCPMALALVFALSVPTCSLRKGRRRWNPSIWAKMEERQLASSKARHCYEVVRTSAELCCNFLHASISVKLDVYFATTLRICLT